MRFYRALLHAFPASFRAEYGDEMGAIFARRLRDASTIGAAWLWISTCVDLLANAIAVHFDLLCQDFRYAARSFRRSPGFALTAIVVSALGIGATTAAFTMVDHVLLRPLPFPDQDRLVTLYEDHWFSAGAVGREWDMSPANFRDFKNQNHSFESLGMYHAVSMNLIGLNEPEQIMGETVSADVLPLLGVKPVIGRIFTADDDRDGAPGTVILSFSLWQSKFGGDPGVLGRKLILDDRAYSVIGIMPKDFYFPQRGLDLWTPMRFGPDRYEDRSDTYIYGIGKLRRGVPVTQAGAEMNGIASQLQRAFPKEMAHIGATVVSIRDDIAPQTKPMLLVLMAASLCVLLVACTNLASLLLARAMHRRKELAVRAAMGAGRERLVRQLLTESLILALTGGAIGVAIAIAVLPLLAKLVPVFLPISEIPSIDWRVLSFAGVITILTGAGFGVVPALRACRDRDSAGLRETSRAGGGRRERLRSILVIAEIAGSVVLLVSCGLLLRAMWRVQSVDPGFRTENRLTLQTSLPMPKYENRPAREQFYSRVLSETQALPGVKEAAYISFMPMMMRGGIWPVEIAGHPVELSARRTASLRFVTPGFFGAMAIPIRAGRDVAESDTMTTQFVALVSDSFVRRYWPNENPIGRHFDFGNYDRQVIGVVGDIRVRGLERSSEPQVYLSYKQHEKVSPNYAPKDLVIHTSGDPAALVPALRRIIRAADPDQPVTDVWKLGDLIDRETGTRRVQAVALGSFAIVAFLLAAIGIHGLLAFAVTNRTQEIGVRMALGAASRDILSMILSEGIRLAIAGVLIGAVLAYAAARGLQSLLAGVSPGDAITFASAIALCIVMTIAGSLAPAVRAVRIDPATAIRNE